MKLTAEMIHGFSESVLAKSYDNRQETPACHKEWWELCCSDHPLVAIAAPRGHAKSTAITHAYVLASVLFRDRQFVLVVSDTEGQAIMFLNDIKKELKENEDLIALFDLDPVLEKDAETDIIVKFKDGAKFRIIAKGSEQKVRGAKWNNKRPDLIVCDDLENDEIVMNDERRRKFKTWFLNALLPCRSDRGIVRIVGTILHMDSLLENLMPKLFDKKYTVFEALKSYSTNPKTPWKSVRYRAHPNMGDFSEILWPGKWPKERLLEERQKYLDAGTPEGYSQEYLNYPIDESHSFFKRGDFLAMTERDKECHKLYYVAVDLAITENDRSNYSVFTVGGMDEEGILHIPQVIRERADAKEIIDIFFQLEQRYHPELFIIEAGAIEKSIGPFLYAEMLKPGRTPLNIMTKVPSKDKEFRAQSIQARMRAGGVKFDKEAEWYPEFEMECLQFPRSKYDDQVDSFAWLGLALAQLNEAPTARERAQEEYEDELKLFFSQSETGRCVSTGY